MCKYIMILNENLTQAQQQMYKGLITCRKALMIVEPLRTPVNVIVREPSVS